MSTIKLFEERQVRAAWNDDEQKWYFSIIDAITILVGSDRPRKYWNDLKKKLLQEGYVEVSEKIGQLKMLAPDGKMRVTDAADAETLLRIIQSIPSPKAEPFKRWLAEADLPAGSRRSDHSDHKDITFGLVMPITPIPA